MSKQPRPKGISPAQAREEVAAAIWESSESVIVVHIKATTWTTALTDAQSLTYSQNASRKEEICRI